ncbi:hypothetical protein J7E50_15555 [Pedobacter sp. ISL-68]|uniref:hypothetical protein n=1 Tax=unclassified Pedobacter TaxID=2628915 RepID=UPI001BE9B936|nr:MULTISPECIES: hypothetical protein [unclassified Pedobacter]MBT2562059.1 hypothetical protein [Pedobacter sp. ISL-64]MBT2591646.1 hypothetical protein [Pedobacter sp. ISL-68]
MNRLNLTVLYLVTTLLFSCKTEPDSKAIRQEVLNIHDKLMIDGEKVVKNKMKLDKLLVSDQIKLAQDSVLQKQKINDLIIRLNAADEKMMDWMHFFKDDFKGKTEQEDLDYYKSEMVKIRAVEDSYIKVTRESDSLINVYQIK